MDNVAKEMRGTVEVSFFFFPHTRREGKKDDHRDLFGSHDFFFLVE